MQVTAISHLDKRQHSDVLILPFWKEKTTQEKVSPQKEHPDAACDLGRLKAKVEAPILAKDFSGKEGETIWLYSDSPEEKRLLLLGLGEKEGVTLERIRKCASQAAKACIQKKLENVSMLLPEVDAFYEEELIRALLEGILLVNYSFTSLKSHTLSTAPQLLKRLCLIGCDVPVVEQEADHVLKVFEGVFLARDLTNGNADDVTPLFLAELAKKLGSELAHVKVKVHDKAWIEKQGMGLFLAVSRGAKNEPYFITMNYQGNPNSSDHTVIVGKGITYDTGGLCIKPPTSMEVQRSDMAGAAICFGVIQACARLKLAVNVTCVIAACENAIGSQAYKPGDVYKSCSGKTVEIVDTDAEGRLTLADALYWANNNLKPSRIIDFATLTGSIIVALGHELFGLFSNSDLLARELLQSGEKTRERAWQFPLYEEYRDRLKSDLADMKNTGGREGGPIIAAAFLQDFVHKTPWAHCDIAGVAYAKEARGYLPKYGTGVGVRLMIDFLEHHMKKGL